MSVRRGDTGAVHKRAHSPSLCALDREPIAKNGGCEFYGNNVFITPVFLKSRMINNNAENAAG